MKKSMKHIALPALAAATSLTGYAQSETTMTDIYEKGSAVISMLEDQHDKEIVRIEYDIVTTSKTTTRVLNDCWTYTIVGFADYRVEDLDVIVYRKQNGSWVEVARDTDTDSTPIVTVTPSTTQEYKIEVRVADFKAGESAAHYGLMICHDQPQPTASYQSGSSENRGNPSNGGGNYKPQQPSKKQPQQPRKQTEEPTGNGMFRPM